MGNEFVLVVRMFFRSSSELPCPEICLKWYLFLFRVFWGCFEAQSRLFLGFAETSFAYHPQDGQDVPGNKSILNVKRQKKNKNPIFSNRI